ncbi:MAG: hypothetical protein NTV77_03105 [Candidatus Azambacteria bacterium]|nr:hypothetical protein [Candidatus Azambacteria bacterium]
MLTFSIIALAMLFLANILFGMKFGFGFRHYWFFELEHFLGGFFIAMFLSNFMGSLIAIFIGLAIITFAWEMIEYLIAYFKKTATYMKRTFKEKNVASDWKDTILDISLNFLGATIFVYFVL